MLTATSSASRHRPQPENRDLFDAPGARRTGPDSAYAAPSSETLAGSSRPRRMRPPMRRVFNRGGLVKLGGMIWVVSMMRARCNRRYAHRWSSWTASLGNVGPRRGRANVLIDGQLAFGMVARSSRTSYAWVRYGGCPGGTWCTEDFSALVRCRYFASSLQVARWTSVPFS